MIVGVQNYAQAEALKSPFQTRPSFEEQNTAQQKATSNTAQPRDAEIASSIASDSENLGTSRQSREDAEPRRSEERGSNLDVVV